jgi:hypothetical protein
MNDYNEDDSNDHTTNDNSFDSLIAKARIFNCGPRAYRRS